jgi:phosphatidylserine/phosphatidylglycerophosphate/cardiolipin synthase-like enzyme
MGVSDRHADCPLASVNAPSALSSPAAPRASRTPPTIEAPSRRGVEWLIDNAAAYDAMLHAIAGARQSVWISQLGIDADCVAHRPRMRGAPAEADDDRPILDALVGASRDRGVDIRILLNASLLLDTAKPLRAVLARLGETRIQVRGISRFPQLLHAKMLIVDDVEAFLLGSPFVNGYWDDSRHRPTDARRPARELGGRPLHDVSVRLAGAPVHDLATIFAELWNDVSLGPTAPEAVHARARPTHRTRDDGVRIVRTTPKRTMARNADGHMEILDAIEDGIAHACSLIYIEHQYLSARPVIAALARALARSPALEIVMVLNQNPDVTAYRGWQNVRLREAGLLDHPRVGLFALWSAEPSGVRWALNQVFVHSKVLTVDDAWATVGSANLDGVSLHSYGDDFVGGLGRWVFRDVRNIDVNVVVETGRTDVSSVVRDLRTRLWAEHLGTVWRDDAARPPGGWLAHWRECAARNVAALNVDPRHPAAAALGSSFVLPYSPRPTPVEQLVDVGVAHDSRRHDLRFEPGWLEVYCSPNWIRNMFA